ncbi:unnamed protein product, partial [Prorocentrum cordatum]
MAHGGSQAKRLQFFVLKCTGIHGYINMTEFLLGCFRLTGEAKTLDLLKLQYQSEWMMHNIMKILDALNATVQWVPASTCSCTADSSAMVSLRVGVPARARHGRPRVSARLSLGTLQRPAVAVFEAMATAVRPHRADASPQLQTPPHADSCEEDALLGATFLAKTARARCEPGASALTTWAWPPCVFRQLCQRRSSSARGVASARADRAASASRGDGRLAYALTGGQGVWYSGMRVRWSTVWNRMEAGGAEQGSLQEARRRRARARQPGRRPRRPRLRRRARWAEPPRRRGVGLRGLRALRPRLGGVRLAGALAVAHDRGRSVGRCGRRALQPLLGGVRFAGPLAVVHDRGCVRGRPLERAPGWKQARAGGRPRRRAASRLSPGGARGVAGGAVRPRAGGPGRGRLGEELTAARRPAPAPAAPWATPCGRCRRPPGARPPRRTAARPRPTSARPPRACGRPPRRGVPRDSRSARGAARASGCRPSGEARREGGAWEAEARPAPPSAGAEAPRAPAEAGAAAARQPKPSCADVGVGGHEVGEVAGDAPRAAAAEGGGVAGAAGEPPEGEAPGGPEDVGSSQDSRGEAGLSLRERVALLEKCGASSGALKVGAPPGGPQEAPHAPAASLKDRVALLERLFLQRGSDPALCGAAGCGAASPGGAPSPRQPARAQGGGEAEGA